MSECKHEWSKGKMFYGKSDCPYCEINRLKAELVKWKELHDSEITRSENLEHQLAEVQQSLYDMTVDRNELRVMLAEAKETINIGIANCNDCENGFICRDNEQLKAQLAEAMTEVERCNRTIAKLSKENYEARQEAVREVLEWAAGPESYDEWVVMVRERYGLEG